LFNEELGVFVGIASKGRSFRVEEQEKICGKATWFVPFEEVNEYKEAGAGNVIESPPGLSASRNAVLEEAFKNNQNCIMLDDDIKGYKRVKDDKSLEDISFKEVIVHLKREINIFKFAGVSEDSNLFYFDPNRPISKKSLIACTYLVKPSTPRFDTNLAVSEDMDFTLQHISKYGASIRLNYLRNYHYGTMMDNKKLTFKRTIEGGIEYSIDVQKHSFDYLMKKWKGKVRSSKTPFQVRIN